MSAPYFPLYVDDFEADTAHLTILEDGAYNRLLRLCWRSPGCKMPADEEWIFRKVRATTDEDRAIVRTILTEFFTKKGGKIFSPRLLAEWSKANDSIARRISAGSKGGRAKALKSNNSKSSNAVALLKQPEPEPEPESVNSDANASDGEAVDPAKAVFDAGVRVLGGCGVPERQARAFIGKLRKANPGQDGQILSAIMDCGRAGAVDPIPWLEARMKPKPSARLFDLSAFGTQPQ